MVQKRSNRGVIIDFDKLIAEQGDRPAMGNMGVDAKGNKLGPNGTIIQKNEDRVRKYIKDNPITSNDRVSLKGNNKLQPDNAGTHPLDDIKTAKTAQENVRTAPPVEEPDEFAEPEVEPLPEPLGYNEVELPNGDIDMIPYYNEEDKITKPTKRKKK